MRGLVALQLIVLAAVGLATVVRFPVFALVDERAHYAYVQEVAEQQRLPWLGRSYLSPEAEAVDEGVYPSAPRVDPRTRGLAGFSYEAFQPPLYYALAAPVFAAAGDDYARKLTALRALGLVALLVAAGLLWKLSASVARGSDVAAPVLFAGALTVLLWPGVVVRTVTVSNAALELVLGVAASWALWEAWTRRSSRWLLGAGAVVGLGLLTRLSFAAFGPLLLVVAVRGGFRPRAALVALALPVLLLLPWVASNLDRYGAATAGGVVREMQEATLNPAGKDFGVADLPDRHRALLNGVLAEEWWSEYLSAPKRRVRDVGLVVLFLVPLGLALHRRRALGARWLLGLPLVTGLALMSVGLLVGNWDFFYPRYLYAVLPAFAVLGAFAVARTRAALPAFAAVTVALTGLWAYLSTVTPFVP